MNRRSFLAIWGLAACRGPQPKHPRPSHHHYNDEAVPTHGYSEIPWRPKRVQLARPQCAAHGDRLAVIAEAHLQVWDLGAMTRISTLDVDYCDVCFLDDGRVAALYASNVDLVDRRGNVLTVGGVREPCGAYTRISARGNLIYVSDHSGVAVYELDYEIVVPQAMIKLEGIDQIEAIAGGRLAALGGGSLHIAGANAVPAWIRLPDDAVLHLCPLPDGMAWLALEDTRGEQGPGPERITLAPVDDPLKPRLTINVAPWTVWDLAATPTAVAALLHHLEPGAREPQGRDLVIYGTDGRERWRTPVDKTDMNAFVALGDTRVVVVRGDRKLDAWDVATGARVPVA